MGGISFIKMHGLGNDFVVIDGRDGDVSLDAAQARAIADRHTGIGCDQLIVIEAANGTGADAFMRIRNADGGEVAACGNATRCVARLLMDEMESNSVRIDTSSGPLLAENALDGAISVDMGIPGLTWDQIPLAAEADTLHLDLALGPLSDPVAVSIGNPHAVFFPDDPDAVELDRLGPELEHHAMFPERANIGIAQVTGQDSLRLRVWERGAGITQACGTGACAATVAASRRGLTGRLVRVTLDGGQLAVEWRDDDHVIMAGLAAVSFTGTIPAPMPT